MLGENVFGASDLLKLKPAFPASETSKSLKCSFEFYAPPTTKAIWRPTNLNYNSRLQLKQASIKGH